MFVAVADADARHLRLADHELAVRTIPHLDKRATAGFCAPRQVPSERLPRAAAGGSRGKCTRPAGTTSEGRLGPEQRSSPCGDPHLANSAAFRLDRGQTASQASVVETPCVLHATPIRALQVWRIPGMQHELSEQPEAVVLVCGSFSPITYLHLRVLSAARREAEERGFRVSHALLSPVHGAYKKPGLLPVEHRLAMALAAVPTWARVDDWETRQYSPPRSWAVVGHAREHGSGPDAIVVFACGADLVRSMAREDGWTVESVSKLLDVAVLAVAGRPDVDIDEALAAPVFRRRKDRIWRLETDESSVSSTMIREKVRVGENIYGLTPDDVVVYIRDHALFQEEDSEKSARLE